MKKQTERSIPQDISISEQRQRKQERKQKRMSLKTTVKAGMSGFNNM